MSEQKLYSKTRLSRKLPDKICERIADQFACPDIYIKDVCNRHAFLEIKTHDGSRSVTAFRDGTTIHVSGSYGVFNFVNVPLEIGLLDMLCGEDKEICNIKTIHKYLSSDYMFFNHKKLRANIADYLKKYLENEFYDFADDMWTDVERYLSDSYKWIDITEVNEDFAMYTEIISAIREIYASMDLAAVNRALHKHDELFRKEGMFDLLDIGKKSMSIPRNIWISLFVLTLLKSEKDKLDK